MAYEQVKKPSSSVVPVQKKVSGFAPPASRVQAKQVTAGEQEQIPKVSTPATDANWLMKHPLFKGNQFLQRVVAPASESLESEESLAQRETVQRQEEGNESGTPYSLPVQAKLTIGEPGDKYEQEADRVASQVVAQINSPDAASSSQGQSVQRQEAPVEELQRQPSISDLQRSPLPLEVQREAMPEEDDLQAKSILQRREAIAGGEASTDLDTAINSARGGGQPLEAGLQRSMGQAMGADFSGVRVHTDAQSDQLNQSIQAKAFTTGQDVFFRSGAYDPGSRGGQELLAHELTHVVQQSGGAVQRSSGKEENLDLNSEENENEAEENCERDPLEERDARNQGTLEKYLRVAEAYWKAGEGRTWELMKEAFSREGFKKSLHDNPNDSQGNVYNRQVCDTLAETLRRIHQIGTAKIKDENLRRARNELLHKALTSGGCETAIIDTVATRLGVISPIVLQEEYEAPSLKKDDFPNLEQLAKSVEEVVNTKAIIYEHITTENSTRMPSEQSREEEKKRKEEQRGKIGKKQNAGKAFLKEYRTGLCALCVVAALKYGVELLEKNKEINGMTAVILQRFIEAAKQGMKKTERGNLAMYDAWNTWGELLIQQHKEILLRSQLEEYPTKQLDKNFFNMSEEIIEKEPEWNRLLEKGLDEKAEIELAEEEERMNLDQFFNNGE
jgi:hypothetical protein